MLSLFSLHFVGANPLVDISESGNGYLGGTNYGRNLGIAFMLYVAHIWLFHASVPKAINLGWVLAVAVCALCCC